ncbi:MAG: hypothetical protein SGARI_001265, partial [Bacillariaceae sp.]
MPTQRDILDPEKAAPLNLSLQHQAGKPYRFYKLPCAPTEIHGDMKKQIRDCEWEYNRHIAMAEEAKNQADVARWAIGERPGRDKGFSLTVLTKMGTGYDHNGERERDFNRYRESIYDIKKEDINTDFGFPTLHREAMEKAVVWVEAQIDILQIRDNAKRFDAHYKLEKEARENHRKEVAESIEKQEKRCREKQEKGPSQDDQGVSKRTKLSETQYTKQ